MGVHSYLLGTGTRRNIRAQKSQANGPQMQTCLLNPESRQKKYELSEYEFRLQLPLCKEDKAATSFQVRNVYLDDNCLYFMQILAHD